MSLPRVLVTGTGRCGTEWCAEVLRAAGYHVGHQAVIRHEHVLGRTPIDADGFDVEVSYEAAPLSALFTRVVLVHRHPYHVARSWVALGAFDDHSGYDDLHEVLRRYCPRVLRQSDPMGRALMFWNDWNRLTILNANAAVLPIAGLTPAALLAACGLPGESTWMVPTDLNNRDAIKRPVRRPTVESIPRETRAEFVALAGLWGYGLGVAA